MVKVQYTTSLDPYLGTYHIIWDSESSFEPRTPTSPIGTFPRRDLRDGVLTLSRPKPAVAWPKEPAPREPWTMDRSSPWATSSSVVLHLYDTYLGADCSASKLTPSICASPAASSSSISSSSSSSISSSSSSPSSPYSSLSSLSLSIIPATRSWRFNWDRTFPRLGYRFEGMDVTTKWGHSLSFSEVTDDSGFPFAVLELRPAGFLEKDGDPDAILVLAKRQRDQYGREGLTETERLRLDMREV